VFYVSEGRETLEWRFSDRVSGARGGVCVTCSRASYRKKKSPEKVCDFLNQWPDSLNRKYKTKRSYRNPIESIEQQS